MTRDLFLSALEAGKFKVKLANGFGVWPVPYSWHPPSVPAHGKKREKDRTVQLVPWALW